MNNRVSIAYTLGVLGALLIMAYMAWRLADQTRPEPVGRERAQARERALGEVRASEKALLMHYAWQDQTRGIVRLPINRAMELTVLEYQNPEAARQELFQRLDKATEPPPRPPEEPSEYE
jgi:hypothetical protein